jgi:hypothetical protein
MLYSEGGHAVKQGALLESLRKEQSTASRGKPRPFRRDCGIRHKVQSEH